VSVHAELPPVGFVEVTTSPAPSTATHNDADGHDTAVNPFRPTPEVTAHADAPPVGFVEVTTSPPEPASPENPPTATHNEALGHETSTNDRSTEAADHSEAPPAGFVEVSTFPRSSAATHNGPAVHETAESWFGPPYGG
jgi:hypothetical protein